jgi:hypothetical protein
MTRFGSSNRFHNDFFISLAIAGSINRVMETCFSRSLMDNGILIFSLLDRSVRLALRVVTREELQALFESLPRAKARVIEEPKSAILIK